jgi:uncharacterized membrane protein YfcA
MVGVMLFAGLVHGTLGLGFPMVATPMLATMMDVRAAILVTLIPTMAVNIVSIAKAKDSLDTARQFLPLVVFALFGSIIGASILATTDPAPFRIILAGLILMYLSSTFIARIPKQWLTARPILPMAAFGISAGIAAGTTNVMVAVLIIYLLSLETPRNVMIPVLNSCFLVGKASQIVVLAIAGFVSLRLVVETTPLAIAAVAALLIGQRLQPRIQVSTYQSILRKLLLVLAIILMIQFFSESGSDLAEDAVGSNSFDRIPNGFEFSGRMNSALRLTAYTAAPLRDSTTTP